jgi:hypothetical protein
MAKTPITDRTVFQVKNPDGTYRFLDWQLVNTSIGAMMEPRAVPFPASLSGTNLRSYQSESFDRIEILDEDKLTRFFGVSGHQLPSDYWA